MYCCSCWLLYDSALRMKVVKLGKCIHDSSSMMWLLFAVVVSCHNGSNTCMIYRNWWSARGFLLENKLIMWCCEELIRY